MNKTSGRILNASLSIKNAGNPSNRFFNKSDWLDRAFIRVVVSGHLSSLQSSFKHNCHARVNGFVALFCRQQNLSDQQKYSSVISMTLCSCIIKTAAMIFLKKAKCKEGNNKKKLPSNE